MRLIWGGFHLEDRKVRGDWGQRASSADLNFKGLGRHDSYHQEFTSVSGADPAELFQWAVERVMRYQVFPPNRMRALVDAPDGRVIRGATILQGVFVGPFRLRMADRVLEVFEGEDEKEKWARFTYGTLQGHAERGIETFRVVLNKAEGRVHFSMEAWSLAGHWLTRLFYPWARYVQKKAGREAMEYMRSRLEGRNE